MVAGTLVFHVSPQGDDRNPGTESLPFRTLAAAAQAVRSLPPDTTGDVVVSLRQGLYPVPSPVVLDARDSGRGGGRVVYRSHPGETATITGGVPVTGWEPDTIHGIDRLWKVRLPDLDRTRHLFIDGRRAVRARSEARETNGWNRLDDPEMRFDRKISEFASYLGTLSIHEGYRTSRVEMLRWRNPTDIEFVFDVGWTHSICPVDAIEPDGDGAFVRMRMPCFKDCQIKGGVQVGSPTYIENAFELLTDPGEWYFDRSDRTLYYIALPGEDMEKVEAVVPVAECLLDIRGTLDAPVRDIVFQDLEFRHSTWLHPSIEGLAEAQANLAKDPGEDRNTHTSFRKPQAAVHLSAACDVAFEGCRFRSLGCTAIDIEHGSRRNRISGCVFTDISGTGIQIGGFTLPDAHPEDPREVVSDNSVTDCHLHGIGVEFRAGVGVLAGYTRRTTIARNEIHDVSYTGVSVGWGWGYWDKHSDGRLTYPPPDFYPRFHEPTVACGNVIECNHIHHVLQKLHDGGGIYTLSMQAGSVIRGNHVHDNGCFSGDRFERDWLVGNSTYLPKADLDRLSTIRGFPGGIYLDEASGGFTVTGNLVYNVAVPFNYHDVGMDGRCGTNRIQGNFFNIAPTDTGFPATVAESAGLSPQYRHLLDQ